MTRLEADHHEARIGGGVGRVDRGETGGEAQVRHHHREVVGRNDLVDQLLEPAGQVFGHLDSRAERSADVDDELAGVGAREQLGADPGRHREAGDEQRGDRSDNQQLAIQRAREHPFVPQGEAIVGPDERREYAVAGAFLLRARLFGGQEPRAEDRNHAHRDQVGGNHRQDHRQRQRAEQVLRDAEQEQHRKEHDDGRDGRRPAPRARPLRRRLWPPAPALCPAPDGG